jgi:hypothetical protein
MQAQVANGAMEQLVQSQAPAFAAEASPDQLWRQAQDIPQLRSQIINEMCVGAGRAGAGRPIMSDAVPALPWRAATSSS